MEPHFSNREVGICIRKPIIKALLTQKDKRIQKLLRLKGISSAKSIMNQNNKISDKSVRPIEYLNVLARINSKTVRSLSIQKSKFLSFSPYVEPDASHVEPTRGLLGL